MASIDELTTPLTADEVREAIYSALARVGVSTAGWKPGGVVRAIVTAVAVVFAAFTELTAAVTRSGFLELAEGEWLTVLAANGYGVARIEATFATGEVTLTNSGGGVYSLDPGDLIVTNPTTGKSYRNTAAISLGALSTATAAIEAIEQGATSTSAAGAITQLETALLGVTCSNALAVVGADAESDSALRARCYEKMSALSPNGSADAYAYFAKSAVRADGTAIGVTRCSVTRNSTIGAVTVTVATPTGPLAAEDLTVVDETIQTQAVPCAVECVVQNGVEVEIDVTCEVWYYAAGGLSNSTIQSAVTAALVAYVSERPIGGDVIPPSTGYVFADALRTVIGAAHPAIFHVALTSPAADVAIADDEVPVLGTVAFTEVHGVTR